MKLLLKRLTGSWDPNIPNTNDQLHFGPTHFTKVNMKLFEGNPMFDIIMDEIERGVLVDERGMNPFEAKAEVDDAPIYKIDSCYFTQDEFWPCKYSVNGSCPVDCIHDQTPPVEEEEDTGFVCTACDGPVKEEDTECPNCGDVFDVDEPEGKSGEEDDAPLDVAKTGGETLTPVGEMLANLPKDFDEAMEQISAMSYADVRVFAKKDGMKVKASGKKADILKRIKKRLQEVWGE